MAKRTRSTSVTGCIVARDEAPLIAACIESLRGAVDEVIVVDHGSRDDTVAVARDAGARIVRSDAAHHEVARNAYLEAARTPWVLVVDADERISDSARAAIPSLARGAPPQVFGFGLERFDYIGRGRWAASRIVRLFRAHPSVRYFPSRAHASVVPSIEAQGGHVAHADAPLHHLDALLPRDHVRKRAGMRARLEAELADGGMPVMRCFLALELFAAGDEEAATAELHEAIARTPRCEPIARLFLAQQHRARGRLVEAAREAQRVLDGSPAFRGRASAWVVLADAHDRQGDPDAALAASRDALEESQGSAALHLNLASLLEDVDGAAARVHFRAALQANPWILSTTIFGEAASPNIFCQQDSLLTRVPRADVLAARLGEGGLETLDEASLLR